MALTKKINHGDFEQSKVIRFICPACRKVKELKIANSIINQAKQLTTVSITTGLCCEHSFQAFVDKNFQVRGYQKVDFEFTSEKNNTQKEFNDDKMLFENLILNGNYLKYNPKGSNNNDEDIPKKLTVKKASKKKIPQKKKTEEKTALKEIYEDFWEFIDENNVEFREFIINDTRRKN